MHSCMQKVGATLTVCTAKGQAACAPTPSIMGMISKISHGHCICCCRKSMHCVLLTQHTSTHLHVDNAVHHGADAPVWLHLGPVRLLRLKGVLTKQHDV